MEITHTSIAESISTRLVTLRNKLGFESQTDFANKVGIGRSTYAKMENGPNDPSVASLKQIVGHLPQVSMNWLLTGKGEPIIVERKATSEATYLERIRELERELARERAWTEKLYEENQHYRELGKMPASSDAADSHVSIMWIDKAA